MAKSPWFNLFVGAETGILKGINLDKHYFKNVVNFDHALGRTEEILTMCWGDADETQIYCGLKNRKVKIYDVSKGTYEDTGFVVEGGSGDIRGFVKTEKGYITSVESGLLKVWDKDGNRLAFKSVGHHTHRMRHNPEKPWLVATGGKHFENDLKIWNLENLENPVFSAINVPNDYLNIPFRVHVTDMQFIPNSDCIVTGTAYGQIRLYDTRVKKRRPEINMIFDECPVMTMALAHKQYEIIVGTARGRVGYLDIRQARLFRTFKFFAGSVRAIHVHPKKDLVASCGLDRFVRIHELNNVRPLHKIYLKSRLNCVLFRSADMPEEEKQEEEEKTVENEQVEESEVVNDDLLNQETIEEEPNDRIWKKMKIVNEEDGSRQLKIQRIQQTQQKKKKFKKK